MTTTASTRYDSTTEQVTGQSECRLYLVTPPLIDLRLFHGQLSEALNAGDVACIQLRLKDVSDDVIMGAADTLLPLAQEFDIPFLVNGRPDLAARVGADGVHIGQGDASYEEARALLGNDCIIGVSCHDSRHLAMVGAEKGADYVTFGPLFPPKTKPDETCVDIDLVRWWRDVSVVQSAAIGGITPENCTPIVSAGVDFLAVSAGIWDYSDGPGEAVLAFCSAIDHAAMEDPVI